MIRKLLKKLGWNDSDKKPEEYTEKPIHENISQSLNKNEEPAKVNPPTNTKTYVNNSQSVESKESTKENRSDDINNDLRASEWKTENVKKRQINVFVSSTFKDMQAERDELVKRIFPQLRKLCEERSVTWGEVDLRWGITNEQKAEGKVLPICLAEIEHCRPYFIGILGERYGWVDDVIPQAVIEQYDWLNEYKGKSVTELEILHGVLRNPEMSDHAFFYFRDPLHLNYVPKNERINYIEAPIEKEIKKYGLKEAERRVEDRKKNLRELKISIRNSGFPVRENFANPKVLGELVFRDLKDVIDRFYPEGEKLDSLEQARFDHETFAKSRFNVYIECKEYFDRFDAHVKDNCLPLVVVGDSGLGKSALLANWAKRYKENGVNETFLLVHYIGATPDSVDWESMIRRIMGELKLHFGIQQDIPDNPDELKVAFSNWLHMVAEKGGMVLVIDALNQLEDRDGALELLWLPELIPSNIRLIVSSLPGRSLDELNKRGWPTMEVSPLGAKERQELIVNYLKQYSRSLSNQMIEHIASHKQTSNPLYLRALLEEMRVYGDHDTLIQRIDHYLEAPTVETLYDKILERYEQDYDRDRKNLVRDAFSYLWAARKGLSQIEILEILGSNGEPLPGALWSPLYLAAEKSLVNRSGLLTFSNNYLRMAVCKRYLNRRVYKQIAHASTAIYFYKRPLDERKIVELPWQLWCAENYDKLKEVLVDLEIFFLMMTLGREYELMMFWRDIGNRYDLGSVYLDSIKATSVSGIDEYKLSMICNQVATFLEMNSKYIEAESLYKKALEIRKRLTGTDSPQTSFMLTNLGLLFFRQGRYSEAGPLIQRSLEINENSLGTNNPITVKSYANMASILEHEGDLQGAEQLLTKSLKIYETTGNLYGKEAGIIQNNLADILSSQQRIEEAEDFYRKALSTCERSIGMEHPLTANVLSNFGALLNQKKSYDEARTMLRRALVICETTLGEKHPQTAITMNNLGTLLYNEGDYDSAEPLLRKASQVKIEIQGMNNEDTITCMSNLAMTLHKKGHSRDAEDLLGYLLQFAQSEIGPDHSICVALFSNLTEVIEKSKPHRLSEENERSLVIPCTEKTSLFLTDKLSDNESISVYVSSCLNINLEDQQDDRVWSNIEELRSIPQKVYGGSINEARSIVESAKPKYPDLDFLYIWKGIIGKKLGIPGEPRLSLDEGLKKCKKKATLCSEIGDEAFEDGNLEDAIRWWIRSCVLQHVGGRYYCSNPLLYLAYFAAVFGMMPCHEALIAKHDSVHAGQVRFDQATTYKIGYLTQKMATEDMKNAIKLLCRDYLDRILLEDENDPFVFS